jgi:hypothetical protein
MEAIRSSETLVTIYKTTRGYNPEDHSRHIHRRENTKSQLVTAFALIMCIFNF